MPLSLVMACKLADEDWRTNRCESPPPCSSKKCQEYTTSCVQNKESWCQGCFKGPPGSCPSGWENDPSKGNRRTLARNSPGASCNLKCCWRHCKKTLTRHCPKVGCCDSFSCPKGYQKRGNSQSLQGDATRDKCCELNCDLISCPHGYHKRCKPQPHAARDATSNCCDANPMPAPTPSPPAAMSKCKCSLANVPYPGDFGCENEANPDQKCRSISSACSKLDICHKEGPKCLPIDSVDVTKEYGQDIQMACAEITNGPECQEQLSCQWMSPYLQTGCDGMHGCKECQDECRGIESVAECEKQISCRVIYKVVHSAQEAPAPAVATPYSPDCHGPTEPPLSIALTSAAPGIVAWFAILGN